MLINEIREFYKTASKDQIRSLLESRNYKGAEAWANIIHAHNNEDGWVEMTSEEFDKRLAENFNVNAR